MEKNCSLFVITLSTAFELYQSGYTISSPLRSTHFLSYSVWLYNMPNRLTRYRFPFFSHNVCYVPTHTNTYMTLFYLRGFSSLQKMNFGWRTKDKRFGSIKLQWGVGTTKRPSNGHIWGIYICETHWTGSRLIHWQQSKHL